MCADLRPFWCSFAHSLCACVGLCAGCGGAARRGAGAQAARIPRTRHTGTLRCMPRALRAGVRAALLCAARAFVRIRVACS
jgi:hypothetical protein